MLSGGVGPEGTQITKVCTNVHTCMYICHLDPNHKSMYPPPPPPASVACDDTHDSVADSCDGAGCDAGYLPFLTQKIKKIKTI